VKIPTFVVDKDRLVDVYLSEDTRKTETGSLAEAIAIKVFPHHVDRQRCDELETLLVAFAAEIKRSAIGG
jgi:hypothetical protein